MWRSGRSPWATIPIPGSAWCRVRIVSRAARLGCPRRVRQRRMSTIVTSMLADVPDQFQALGAIGGLMDLEVASQGFAHSEANQRVSVDHKAMWALGTQSLDPSRAWSAPVR